MPIFFKLFHTIESRNTAQFIYEATVTMIPKPHKDSTKGISFMNIDAKILDKILANLIEEQIKKIYP